MFSIKPNNGKFDIIGSYLTWTILGMSPDLVKKTWVFAKRCGLNPSNPTFSSGKSSSNLFALPMESHMRKTMEKKTKSEWFQIVKPHFSHDSGHFYGCTECSYHIIRKHIMILTVTNQNRHWTQKIGKQSGLNLAKPKWISHPQSRLG